MDTVQKKIAFPRVLFAEKAAEKAVESSEAYAAVPKGYRIATVSDIEFNLREIGLSFKYQFFDATSHSEGVWAEDQTGTKDKSGHYPLVLATIEGYDDIDYWHDNVVKSNPSPKHTAPVAYVAIKKEYVALREDAQESGSSPRR